jgi:hypothetical protein
LTEKSAPSLADRSAARRSGRDPFFGKEFLRIVVEWRKRGSDHRAEKLIGEPGVSS